MKRSHSTAELPAFRPVVPKTSDDRECPAAPAPDEPVPAPSAEPNAVQHVPMAFPGPFAYVPRPAAMQDSDMAPGSASSASSVRERSAQGVKTPTFPDVGRRKNQVEPALAAAAASTSDSSSASSTDSVASAENPNGYPPLILAAFKGNHAALEVLLRDPALDIHQRDPKSGMSALLAAAVGGRVEMLPRLIAAGADVDLRQPLTGVTDLMGAAARNLPDVVTHLLAAGAKVNLVVLEQRLTALMLAAGKGHVEVVKKLVAHKDIALDQPDAGGRSALYWAATKNKPDVVACLLAGGASMTQVADFRQTAQTVAIRNKHAAVLEVLVSYGADVSSIHYFDPDPTAFDVTLADLDADRKSPANPERNPLGLLAPASLDHPLAVIDDLLAVLDPKRSLYTWLKAKGIRKACALPLVECVASLADTWPTLANGARAPTAIQKRLICAAALSRLSVLTAEGKALAHYKAAGISAAGIARLSAVATRQIDKLIAVSEQLLTTMGGDMLEKLVPACLSRIGLDNQADTATLSADLVSAGWIKPLAQAIAKSWKSALATLEAEPLAIKAGSTVQQIMQCVLENTERKAPLYFAPAMQGELAAPTLPAALRTWVRDARPAAALDMLFQIQCKQLRQYCERIVGAG
jgi:ankyrin repeat protein